jgi:hypothetical protein
MCIGVVSLQCIAGVPNRAWSDTTAQNDIALCFLETPSRFPPVKLADQGGAVCEGFACGSFCA